MVYMIENKETELLESINNAFNVIVEYVDLISEHLEFRPDMKEEYLNTIINNIETLIDKDGITRVSVSDKDWNDMKLYKEFIIFAYRIREMDSSLFNNIYSKSNNREFNEFITDTHKYFKYNY